MNIKQWLCIGLLGSCATLAQAKDLLTVYQMALEQDPVLKQALAQRNATRENRPLAVADLLPLVNVSANSTSLDPAILNNSEFSVSDSGVIRSNGYEFSAQQTIIDFSKWFTLGEANYSVNAADSTYTAQEQDLILRVARAYFDVLNAADDLAFTQAEKNTVEQQLKETEEKFNVGLVAITDLSDFRARFDQSVAQEITAQNNLGDAKERLKVIIGDTLVDLSPLKPKIPLESPAPANIEDWVEFAQKNNPLLAASNSTMNAKRNSVNKEKSKHLPTITASGNFVGERTGTIISPGNDSDNGWYFSVDAQMNLFAGGGIQAAVRKAQYDYQDSRESFEETRRTTISNSRIAYRGVLTAIGQVRSLTQAVISAETSLKANQAAYEVGTKTAVDVLDALSRLYDQQRNLAAARYSYILNMLALKQAAGTLSAYDVAQVNEWLGSLET